MHMFKGLFYFFETIFGHYVLGQLSYFPKSLFGKGYMSDMFLQGYPQSFYFEKPPLFDLHYMICLTYPYCSYMAFIYI